MRRAEQEVRPSPAERRIDLLLWIAVLVGPLAMAINTVVGYSVAHWVCDVNRKGTSFAVSAVDFVLCVFGFMLAFWLYRRQPASDESLPDDGRRSFMAKMGMLMSGLSLLLVIGGTIAVLTLHPCD